MADGVSHAEKLARIIQKARIAELEGEYYERVSRETYNRWYGKKWNEDAYLDPKKHGGFSRWESTNIPLEGMREKRYYMLKTKFDYYRGKGRKTEHGWEIEYHLDKKRMKRVYREAEWNRKFIERKSVKVYKKLNTVTIELPYNSPIKFYKKSEVFAASINDKTQSEFRMIRKNGRLNKVEHLILKAIDEWARKNHVSCLIEGSVEIPNENFEQHYGNNR